MRSSSQAATVVLPGACSARGIRSGATALCPGALPPLRWNCGSPQPRGHSPVPRQRQAAGTRDAAPSHLCQRGEVSSSLSRVAATEAAASALFVINREKQALSGATHLTSVRYIYSCTGGIRSSEHLLIIEAAQGDQFRHRHVK